MHFQHLYHNMRDSSFLTSCIILLTIAKVDYGSCEIISNLVSLADPLDLRDSIPELHLPTLNIKKPDILSQFPSFADIKNNVTELPSSVINKVKEELTDFYTQQIEMFSTANLSIYDDNDESVEFKLELPDFNLLNLFPDLNEAVTFELFTKESKNKREILGVNDVTALNSSKFDTKRHTYFITHGFLASSEGLSCTLIRDALLKRTDSNVITVNWSPLSTGSYTIARYYVSSVGEHIGKFIDFLCANGVNHEKITLIGHSLGAHVMGFAGKTVSAPINHTITLDPAWPLFAFLPESQRLSSDDARFLEVIHTNGGLLGDPGALGDFDFYPNGGFFQSGCLESIFAPCSHGRSYKYLAEQISNPNFNFFALMCESYSEFKKNQCKDQTALMGGISFYSAKPGVYYLQTKDEEPFSLGQNVARL